MPLWGGGWGRTVLFPMTFVASLTLRMHPLLPLPRLLLVKTSSINCFIPWRSLSWEAHGPRVLAAFFLEVAPGLKEQRGASGNCFKHRVVLSKPELPSKLHLVEAVTQDAPRGDGQGGALCCDLASWWLFWPSHLGVFRC